LIGWTGIRCDVFNSNVSWSQFIVWIQEMANQSAQSAALNIGNIKTTLGYGRDLSTRALGLPIVKMDFQSATDEVIIDGNGKPLRLPAETTYEPFFSSSFLAHEDVFRNVKDYADLLISSQEKFQSPFFDYMTLSQVNEKYFQESFLAMNQQIYPLYQLSFEDSEMSIYFLEDNLNEIFGDLENIPYNNATKELFFLVFYLYGTSFEYISEMGGIIQWNAILNNTIWDQNYDEDFVDEQFVKTQANIYFKSMINETTYEDVSSLFAQNLEKTEFRCIGGDSDPYNCSSNILNWKGHLWDNPTTTRFALLPITVIIRALYPTSVAKWEHALRDYLRQNPSQYLETLSYCPKCVHGHCTEPQGYCECDSGNIGGRTCATCSYGWSGPQCNSSGEVGQIVGYGGTNPPENWLLCDGSAVSRTDYPDLFAIIGVAYGKGDNVTTFNLPDFRGRIMVGAGQGPGLTPKNIGELGGEEQHQLNINEMPSHGHTYQKFQALLVQTGSSTPCWSGISNAETSNTGGDQPHNNMQPFQVANVIIKYR